MAVYWGMLGAVVYMLLLARATDPALNNRTMGSLPTATSSRLFLGMAALVLTGVAALRWRVGTDFTGYVRNYDRYKTSFLADLRSFDEPGIKGLAWVVATLRDDPAIFMAAASVITVGLMLLTIMRYSIAIPMSCLLFVFIGTWHGSFNGVRQFLACAIIFAGHRLIIDKRPMSYALIVATAASFHISALVMAPLYLMPNRQLRHRMMLLLAAIAVAALYASDAVLNLVEFVKDDLVLTDYATRAINPLRIAVAIAPVALYWSRGVRTQADGEWFYRNVAIIHAVVMLAASWSAYLGRFGIYTTVFLALAIPRLIDFPDRWVTTVVRTGVLLLFAWYWYIDVSGSLTLSNFSWSPLVAGRGGS